MIGTTLHNRIEEVLRCSHQRNQDSKYSNSWMRDDNKNPNMQGASRSGTKTNYYNMRCGHKTIKKRVTAGTLRYSNIFQEYDDIVKTERKLT